MPDPIPTHAPSRSPFPPPSPDPDERPSRRARRLRPAAVTVGSLGVACAAILGGAALSADAMPPETPPQTDAVVVGTLEIGADGTAEGFECTFTGADAAALTVDLGDPAAEPIEVPATADPAAGVAFGLAVDESGAGASGAGEVEGSPDGGGGIAVEVVPAEPGTEPGAGDPGVFEAEEVPGAALAAPTLRDGTPEECAQLFDATVEAVPPVTTAPPSGD